MINFAYSDDITGWDENKSATSIDLVSTPFDGEIVTGFPKLIRFRASRTRSKTLLFKNLPNLTTVDLQLCMNLETLIFEKCPKISTLDVSYSMNLSDLQGTLNNLVYLSCPSTKVHLQKLPKLAYLDISWTTSPMINFSNFPCLECFTHISMDCSTIYLSKISQHRKLREVHLTNCEFIFDSFDKRSELRAIVLSKCEYSGDLSVLPDTVHVVLPDNQTQGTLRKSEFSFNEKMLDLYGPWGIPPAERHIPTPIAQTIDHPEFDVDQASNCVAGAIFGSALMDMIGLGTEFVRGPVAKVYQNKLLDSTWDHPRITEHTGSFIRGTSTDDTSQAVLIMRSLVKSNLTKSDGKLKVDIMDFAQRMLDWMKNGHVEHKDGNGLGLGKTTKAVLNHEEFLTNPKKAAEEVWESMGRKVAANGSVMRTGPVGCAAFWDEETVMQNAREIGLVTHTDPRCVFSSVCVSLFVSRIIQLFSGVRSNFDVDEAIKDAIAFCGCEDIKDEIMKYANAETLDELELDSASGMGYTLRAFGACCWAQRHTGTFEGAIAQIARAGGDADTNGAVVGAVAGALYGFDGLPKYLIKNMFNGQWLYNEMCPFMEMMGLRPPTSPFL